MKFLLSLPHGLCLGTNEELGEGVIVPQLLKQRKVNSIIPRAQGIECLQKH